MARPSDEGARRRPWWRDVSTGVAIAGVLVALIFNTIGVWRAEREARKSRVAAEVSLLTQVGEGANQAARALVESGANDKRCLQATGLALNDAEEARLTDALTYYDYLAWLFNQGQITLESAMRYWGPDMIDVYDLGTKFMGAEGVDLLYAELAHFEKSADEDRLPDPCGPRSRAGG